MIAGPLCLGGEVGGGETVFTFLQPSPAEAPGSAGARTASAELFPADKIKDARVAVLRRGTLRVLGAVIACYYCPAGLLVAF